MAVHGAFDLRFSSNTPDGFQYGARSHIGQRESNQDDLRLPAEGGFRDGRGALFAVADGMGGHRGGGTASHMACQGLAAYHHGRMPEKGQPGVRILRRYLATVVHRIALQIRLEGRKNPALEDMGTTLSCLVLTERHSIIAHVGDSRIYRLRGGRLTRLTTDHTFVQDMIAEGELTPEKAGSHPLRHMLTRVVGTMEPLAWVDTRIDRRGMQDRYLLSTDGLHNSLGQKPLADFLSADANALEMAIEMVDQALQNGARDNLTAVVVIPSLRASAIPGHNRKRP